MKKLRLLPSASKIAKNIAKSSIESLGREIALGLKKELTEVEGRVVEHIEDNAIVYLSDDGVNISIREFDCHFYVSWSSVINETLDCITDNVFTKQEASMFLNNLRSALDVFEKKFNCEDRRHKKSS